MSRRKKRRRDRSQNRIVQEEFFAWNGRPEIRGRMTRRGELKVVVFDARRVNGVGREHAAHWLRTTFAPRIDHESAYLILWDGVPLL